MANIYKLPFRSNSPYTFTTTAGGNNFKFYIKHAIHDDTYFMDIDMNIDNKFVPIIRCINLTCGCDLFIPFKRYGLGSLFVIPTDVRYYHEVPRADTILTKFVMMWEHD